MNELVMSFGLYKVILDSGRCLNLESGKMEGSLTARRQCDLHSIME